MKKGILFLSLILFVAILVFPAFEYIPGAIKSKSMRFNCTSIVMGIDNAFLNPASITGVDKGDISISYENLFMFTHAFALTGGYRTDYGTVGLKYSEMFVLGDYADMDSVISTGTKLHTERTVQMTYGVKLADVMRVGTNVNALYLEQKNYGSNIYYTADIGIIGTVYNRWNLGIAVKNITNSYISGTLTNTRYYFDRTVSAGVSFEPYDNFITSFDVSKAAGRPTSIGGGLLYELVEDIFILRAGLRSYPMEYAGGFEVKKGQFSIDYGYTATRELSGMHLIQLNYKF
ncbi:MAG: hypothetical protein SVK54_03160 [candidate division WOR-3 bacterium]|nr:hypothetical protein [candidate division WOR-3 bacterium]